MNIAEFSNFSENGEDFLKLVLLALENTYKASDKATRSAAENYLRENQKKIVFYFDTFVNAAKTKNLTKEISNSLFIYIRNSIIQLKKKTEISKELLINLIKSLIDNITSPEFPDYLLKELNLIFDEIINYSIVEDNESIIIEIINLFQTKIEQNSISLKSYKGIGYIFENILCCSTVNNNNCETIIKTELKCADIMLKNLISLLNSVTFDNKSNEQLEEIIFYIDTLKVIFGLLLNICVHLQKTFKKIEIFLSALTTVFFDYGIQLLNISFEDEKATTIKMKTKIFRFIISFLPLLPEYITDQSTKEKHLKIISLCLSVLMDQNFLNKLTMNKFYENYGNQILIYLYKIGFNVNFKIDFEKYLNSFTKQTVFPLLISNNKELNEIEDDEEGTNYANYIYDITLTRKGKNIKVSLSKFLHFGCKSNPQYLHFLIEYSFLLIKSGTQPNSFLAPEDIMTKANNIQKIETAFLVLCIISKNIKSEETKKTIFDCFIGNLQILSDTIKDNSLIRERVCLFISIYIEKFFSLEVNQDFITQICEFLFGNIFSIEKPIAKFESFDALKQIFEQLSSIRYENAITSLTFKYIHQFIVYAKVTKTPLFFDILHDIVSFINNEENISELLAILISRVISEISPRKMSHNSNNEMELTRTLSSQYKVIISKCFNVIQSIFNNKSFIINNAAKIDELIMPLVVYMKYPNKIEFDEDIVIIMTIFIKTLKIVPKSAVKLLPDLSQYLRKCKGLSIDLFELLNIYIIYSNSSIENSEEHSKAIFKLFKKSFAKESYFSTSPYLGTSLIQIWLLNSKSIPLKIVIESLLFANEQVQNLLINNDKSKSSEVSLSVSNQNLSLSLITLLFDAFVNYPVVACNNLNFENLIRCLEIQVSYQVRSPYQIKMLIIGICSIIKNETILKIFSNIISHLLTFSFHFLKKLKKFEKKALKNRNNTVHKLKIIDSDDEDEESEEEIEDPHEYSQEQEEENTNDELKEIDGRIINSYTTIDEFKLFRETVLFLKEKYVMIYNQWYDDYEDEDLIKLNDIIYTSRITITNNKEVINIPRKIVKIKKTQNLNGDNQNIDENMN